MSESAIEKARREVEAEFAQFREQFGRVLEAVEQVSSAGPLDDVHGLLERLEDTVNDVRTGGAFGSGAKGHRSALEKYEKVAAQPS
ncbi:MAG: hypothetical protein OEX04_09035 [Acidimicrobiia bacterium]|nr:hypothetical protein [Acidimicrobiia bacterium]MDH4307608.1 hypothetical protein [Acidimicrobiia bacterium]MDH5293567.1 hypothetical protein [Acidimicrobiia bacterium]